jgi:hypothetical protein
MSYEFGQKEKYNELLKVSNPNKVDEKLKQQYGDDKILYISEKKYKKYKVLNPNTDKYVHFGDIRYFDYTRHKDDIRRARYLKRATNIKGDWKLDKFSPNSLSINLLW